MAQHLPLADRANHRQHGPEYGATCGIFPIDAESLNYLRLSGRSEEINLVEACRKDVAEPAPPPSTAPRWNWTWHGEAVAGRPEASDRVLLEDVQKTAKRWSA